MEQLYQKYKDQDGFLYFQYGEMETYGSCWSLWISELLLFFANFLSINQNYEYMNLSIVIKDKCKESYWLILKEYKLSEMYAD